MEIAGANNYQDLAAKSGHLLLTLAAFWPLAFKGVYGVCVSKG